MGKLDLVNKFGGRPETQNLLAQGALEEKEDFVIFIILTQAARMIQRAFRAYRRRKQIAISKVQIRDELESELEEAKRQRALRSTPHSAKSPQRSPPEPIERPAE